MESNPLCSNVRRAYRENRLGDFLCTLQRNKQDLDRFFSDFLEEKQVIKAMDKFQLEKEPWKIYREKVKEYKNICEAITLANFYEYRK